MCVCETCLKKINLLVKIRVVLLCDFTVLSQEPHLFSITSLCFLSLHGNCVTVLGGGIWGWGNLSYTTGLLSGKGEQWLRGPEWKTLAFRGKAVQTAMNNTEENWKKKKKEYWPNKANGPRFCPKRFFKHDTPKWLTNLCPGSFSAVLLLSPRNENTHGSGQKNWVGMKTVTN